MDLCFIPERELLDSPLDLLSFLEPNILNSSRLKKESFMLCNAFCLHQKVGVNRNETGFNLCSGRDASVCSAEPCVVHISIPFPP